jgi:hypothetical protein
MEPGKFILLDQYDSWLPVPGEPFTDQVRRVRLSPQEIERRRQGAERCRLAFGNHPWYAARAAQDLEYWSKFYATRVNW